jgi:hypothetical protein
MGTNARDMSSHLAAALHGQLTERIVGDLILAAARLATGMLRTRFSRYQAVLEHVGYTMEGAALRTIENLFLPAAQVPCARLRAAIETEGVDPATLSPREAEQLFRRFVFLEVQQTIPDLLGEFDNDYRKILRIVREHLTGKNGYASMHGFYEDHFFRVSRESRLLEQPAIPQDELVGEVAASMLGDETARAVIDRIFDVMESQDTWRRTLAVGVIVNTVRDCFQFFHTSDVEVADHESTEFRTDLDLLIQPAIAFIRRRILASYIRRNVVEPTEADAMAQAAEDMLRDLASQQAQNWFHYFSTHFPDVPAEEYRRTRRIRFEYVMGAAKESFLLHCRHFFQSP